MVVGDVDGERNRGPRLGQRGGNDDQGDDTDDAPGPDTSDDQDDNDNGDDADDDTPLGPKGEKALRAEKDRRRAEAKRRRELEAELAALKNSGDSKDDPDQIRREAAWNPSSAGPG